MFALIRGQQALVGEGLIKIVHAIPEGKTAIGYIPYSGKPYFGIFKRLRAIPTKQLLDTTSFQLELTKQPSKAKYHSWVTQLKKHIAKGDIYQANLTYQLHFKTNATALQLLNRFVGTAPIPYGALIQTPTFSIVSNSPELAVRIANNVVETHPMKGTALTKAELMNAKDQAELDMIIDVHRNDLNQFCKPGTVHVKQRRAIKKYGTVWQAYSVIQGRRPTNVSTKQILQQLLPMGSITGAPKLKAIELLNKVESEPRGVYCGTIGYILPNGNAEFNVAIRTAVLKGKQLTYGVGSGITLLSNWQKEWAETQAKAKALLA